METEAKGWVAEVIADSSGQWVKNGLVFDSETAATAYAADLYRRWTAVREFRARAVDAAPTHSWSNDRGIIELATNRAHRPPDRVQL